MAGPRSAAEYWSSPEVVDAFVERNRAPLPYEESLLTTAAQRAARDGALRRVHVLGVGGGRELPAVRAAAPDAELHAWDISEAMVDRCRRFVARSDLGAVHVRCGDLTDLPADVPPADLVVGVNAVCSYLTSATARARAAASMARLLRPGGAVAVVVQQRRGRPDWALWFAIRSFATRLRLAPGEPGDRINGHGDDRLLVHHYTARELRRMFHRAGFEEIELQSLRSWGRSRGRPVPTGSPNPLLLTAERGAGPAR
jgi:SAM-dependent methyltransferase